MRYVRQYGCSTLRTTDNLSGSCTMRPDEHKKKRSTQYKKKHGISTDSKNISGRPEKGHSDAATGSHGKQTSHSRKGKVQEKDEFLKNNAAAANNSTSSSGSEEEESYQSKTYSRRKIVSNWDRYEMPTAEEGEQVEQRGEDFTKLLNSAGGAVSQFRFRDEQGWEEDVGSFSTGSEFLAVDVNDLSNSLNCLPVYQQLGLDKKLFSKEQLDEIDQITQKNRQFYKPKENVDRKTDALCDYHHGDGVTEVTKDNSNKSNDHSNSERKSNNDLSQLLISKPVENVKIQTSDTCASKSVTVKQTEKDICIKSDPVTSGDTETQEDELDFLLSLDKPSDVKYEGDKTVIPNTSDKHESQKDVSKVQTDAPNTKNVKQDTKAKNETNDLEDWLDSVLDD